MKDFLIKLLGEHTEDDYTFTYNELSKRITTEYERANGFRERLRQAIRLGVKVASKYRDLEMDKKISNL